MLRSVLVLFAFSLLFVPAPVLGHDPGLSSLIVEVRADEFEATFDIANADRSGTALDATALRLEVDGQTAQALSTESLAASPDQSRVRLRYARPPGTRLLVTSARLAHLPYGHKQYARVAGASAPARRLLDATSPSFEVDLAATPRSAGLEPVGFFSLGVEHILEGYDHLLFLFALLVACPGMRAVLRVITAFTIAHSLTLVAATLGWVSVPAAVVEPVIAASIVVVAVLNWFHPEGGRERGLLTFGFGLIHGLGFATALGELGLGGTGGGLVVPLVAFNLGVETGQLLIAALVLPALSLLRRNEGFVRLGVPAFSTFVGALGLFWLIERVGPV